MQALWSPPTFVQISFVVQSAQLGPMVVQGVHWGNQGAPAIHGGIQGLAPPPAAQGFAAAASGAPQPQPGGTAEATVT